MNILHSIMLSETRRTERVLSLTKTPIPHKTSTKIVLQNTLFQNTMFPKNSSEVQDSSMLKIVFGKKLMHVMIQYIIQCHVHCFHV